MPAPRPFGVGPYGVGHYSRYTGEIYEVGGSSTLRFGASAEANRIATAIGGSTGITWAVSGQENRIRTVSAASSITFSARSLGITRIIRPWALTQILFDAWCEHPLLNWMGAPPCVPGAWGDADLCEIGAWASAEPCGKGSWAAAGLAPASEWNEAVPCHPGTWTPKRLT